MSPRIGSLFSGYGGLDLGVQAALGGEVVWHSEIDPNASKILATHWPDVPNLGDITQIDWADVPTVDVLTGGFPCQDVSTAGARAGLSGARSGLWSIMADAIKHLHPRLVVIENVEGLLSATANSNVEPCPWCLGDDPTEPAMRALGAVLADLADLGFDAEWGRLGASHVGAPHRRHRIFITAWPNVRHPRHDARSAEHWVKPQSAGCRVGEPGAVASAGHTSST